MHRQAEQDIGGADLGDPAKVEHGRLVAELADHTEVVRDQQVYDSCLPPKVTLPAATRTRRRMARPMVDLPEPLSPTNPRPNGPPLAPAPQCGRLPDAPDHQPPRDRSRRCRPAAGAAASLQSATTAVSCHRLAAWRAMRAFTFWPSLSRATWKNGDLRMNLAVTIMTKPSVPQVQPAVRVRTNQHRDGGEDED